MFMCAGRRGRKREIISIHIQVEKVKAPSGGTKICNSFSNLNVFEFLRARANELASLGANGEKGDLYKIFHSSRERRREK